MDTPKPQFFQKSKSAINRYIQMYILNLKILLSINLRAYFWEYILTLEKNLLLPFSSINTRSNCTLNTYPIPTGKWDCHPSPQQQHSAADVNYERDPQLVKMLTIVTVWCPSPSHKI